MDNYETSSILHVDLSKKPAYPVGDIHIKQEYDVQDIYIKEEPADEEDITESQENILPEINVEVPEGTTSADLPVRIKLESNLDKSFDEPLYSINEYEQSEEDVEADEIFPANILQIKMEESDESDEANQLNTDLKLQSSCSVNLHNGVNIDEISKCKICNNLKQNQGGFRTQEILMGRILVNIKRNVQSYAVNDPIKAVPVQSSSLYQCKHCGVKCLVLKNLISHIQSHNLIFLLPKNFTNENTNLESCTANDDDTDTDIDIDGDTGNDDSQPDVNAIDNSSIVHPSIVIQPGAQYQCPYCSLKFVIRYNLIKHLEIHNEAGTFKCSECDKEFKNLKSLKTHSRFHSRKEPYQCSDCGKTFVRENLLKAHVKTHTGELFYKCGECDKTFLSEAAMKTHERIHTSARRYECTDCDKTFYSEKTLSKHLSVHSNKKPYKCSECDKEFALESYANRHYLRNHGKQKPYKCNDCSKAFAQYCLLKVHSRKHQKEKFFKCPDCGIKFLDKFKLYKHSKLHLQYPDKKTTKCLHCNSMFLNEDSLNKHVRIHSLKKRYRCSECPEYFTEEYLLKIHSQCHKGRKNRGKSKQKPLKCELCSTLFKSGVELNKHLHVHEGNITTSISVC